MNAGPLALRPIKPKEDATHKPESHKSYARTEDPNHCSQNPSKTPTSNYEPGLQKNFPSSFSFTRLLGVTCYCVPRGGSGTCRKVKASGSKGPSTQGSRKVSGLKGLKAEAFRAFGFQKALRRPESKRTPTASRLHQVCWGERRETNKGSSINGLMKTTSPQRILLWGSYWRPVSRSCSSIPLPHLQKGSGAIRIHICHIRLGKTASSLQVAAVACNNTSPSSFIYMSCHPS